MVTLARLSATLLEKHASLKELRQGAVNTGAGDRLK